MVKVDHPWQPGHIYASGCWQTEGKKPSILIIAYGLQLQLCWSLLHKQITGPTRKALYTVSRDFSWTAVFLGDIYRKLRQLPQTLKKKKIQYTIYLVFRLFLRNFYNPSRSHVRVPGIIPIYVSHYSQKALSLKPPIRNQRPTYL